MLLLLNKFQLGHKRSTSFSGDPVQRIYNEDVACVIASAHLIVSDVLKSIFVIGNVTEFRYALST